MALHSSTLAWKIPGTGEPGRLQSTGSWRVRNDGVTSLSLFTFHFYALEKEMATHSSVLAWRIPGTGEPGGLASMGLHRVGHDWNDLAAAAAHYIVCILNQITFSWCRHSLWGKNETLFDIYVGHTWSYAKRLPIKEWKVVICPIILSAS